MFQGVSQRGGRVDGGEDLAAGRLDIGLEPFNLAMGRLVRFRVARKRSLREDSLGGCGRRRLALRGKRGAGRVAPTVERLQLPRDGCCAFIKRAALLPIDCDLLLLPVDCKLQGVRALSRRRRARLAFDQLKSHAAETGVDFGDPGGRSRLTLARLP